MQKTILRSFQFSMFRLLIPSAAAFLLLAPFALAGPPLICHPFDIGNANSLPWIGHDWNLTGSENYDTRNLANDTLAILDASQSPLVHMETLRRATLYARKDPLAAKQLLVRLVGRVQNDPATAGAFAYFDAAYIAEAYKQWLGEKAQNPAANLNGVPWIEKAIQLRGNDPQMEFAAALIALQDGGAAQARHAQKALDGAQSDPLLAANLKSHFLSGPTMAEMIQREPAKVARQ